MKINKKSKANLPSIIFLLCLFVLVMLYFSFVYPKLSEKLATLEAETRVTQDMVNFLTPQKAKLTELAKTAEDKKLEFEKNQDLHLPVLFSNIIYSAADDAGVIVESLSITENSPVGIEGGFEARSFTASVSLTMKNGEPSNQFIKTIENNEGCAMYITSMAYSKTYQPALENGEEGEVEETAGNDRVSLTINLLTVEKE